MEALRQAAAANPDSDEIFATLGDVHHAAGALDLAVAAYREAARISPRSPLHLLRLGRACRMLGQLDQALVQLQQAGEIAPNDEEILREQGVNDFDPYRFDPSGERLMTDLFVD